MCRCHYLVGKRVCWSGRPPCNEEEGFQSSHNSSLHKTSPIFFFFKNGNPSAWLPRIVHLLPIRNIIRSLIRTEQSGGTAMLEMIIQSYTCGKHPNTRAASFGLGGMACLCHVTSDMMLRNCLGKGTGRCNFPLICFKC